MCLATTRVPNRAAKAYSQGVARWPFYFGYEDFVIYVESGLPFPQSSYHPLPVYGDHVDVARIEEPLLHVPDPLQAAILEESVDDHLDGLVPLPAGGAEAAEHVPAAGEDDLLAVAILARPQPEVERGRAAATAKQL